MLQNLTQWTRSSWLPLVVIVVATVLQIFLITRPAAFLVTNLLPDDAFYYFQIARHIALGAGSTFDGITMTNGYHPLWMVVLVPLYYFFSVGGTWDITPITLALSIQLILNIGTAFVLLLLIRRITTNQLTQAFALLLWCLNPFLLYETLNGLETSLSLFLLLLFIHTVLQLETQMTMRTCVVAGLIGGLLILARLDMAFYVAALGLWLLLTQGFKRAMMTGLITAVVILPWFIWNFVTFHMLFTSASNGNVFINHALVASDSGPGLFVQIKGSVYLLIYHGKVVLERSGAPWLIFLLLGAALTYILQRLRSLRGMRIPLITALFLGGVALFAINAGIRFTGRTWYFVSLYIFLVLGAAWTLEHVLVAHRRILIACLAVLTLGTFVLSWKDSVHNQFISQQGMLAMATWMNENLEAGTRVGVFNAGVQGYFSHVRVTNLDGLVNNAAYEAITRRELWSYIREEEIVYISDFPLYLTYRYKPFLDIPDVMAELEPVHHLEREADGHGVGSLTLYRIKKANP